MAFHPGKRATFSLASISSAVRSWLRVSAMLALLVFSAAGTEHASAQGAQSGSPSIFFLADRYFGVPNLEQYIGAYTPGQAGYVTIVPPISDGTIPWMQLVPGPRRIFWSEARIQPPSTLVTTFWSARAEDGSDRRAEPDLTNATIGPSGIWKYHRAAAANQFARSRLNGSDEELLGFGPISSGSSIPYVDPTEQWVYYFDAELQPPPGLPGPRIALFRGQIASGSTEQLKVFTRRAGVSLAQLRLLIDPENDRIHLFPDPIDEDELFPVDHMLYAYHGSNFGLIGKTAFPEGNDAGLPKFAIDPVGRAYYFTFGGSTLSPESLRRLAYDDLGVAFPSAAPVVLDQVAVGYLDQLDSHPTIRVLEPTGMACQLVAVLAAVGSARLLRRSPSRSR